MKTPKKGLGRGLESLFADNETNIGSSKPNTKLNNFIKTYDIEPNRNQPRKFFGQDALDELASSITEHGIIQPIIVRKKDNGFYEIIAGERRWRAAKMAGLSEVPVVIKELSDSEAALFSMIENLQREDLNPVEEAKGYRSLIDNFNLTQEEAATKVGKSRTSVTNIMRLLKLPDDVLTLVEKGNLSYGHARALIPLNTVYNDNELLTRAKYIIEKQLSVRETESLVKELLNPKAVDKHQKVRQSYFNALENKASEKFGRRLKLTNKALLIPYKDSDDLENLLESLCGAELFEDEVYSLSNWI